MDAADPHGAAPVDAALLARPPAAERFVIDVFSASDEVAMVRYRLRLHEPIAYKTIVLESNYTHTGRPKPLHIANALSAHEVRRFNVELVNVEFTAKQLRAANCTGCGRAAPLTLENAQRSFVNALLLREIAALPAGRTAVVHMSDVDELLDPHAFSPSLVRTCATPVLRMFIYGERCSTASPWGRSVLFNATSGWFEARLKLFPDLQLRSRTGCASCARGCRGCFTYFMGTAHLLSKLRTFSHSTDGFVRPVPRTTRPPPSVASARAPTCAVAASTRSSSATTGCRCRGGRATPRRPSR